MTFKDDLPFRFTKDGFHQYRLDYKKSSVQGTHVTFEHGLSHALTSAHIPMVLESNYRKESLTITNKTQVNEVITKPFTYVSLFSGIGGFETALNRLGGKCVMASEIDKHANKAYEVLYGMPTAGDITKIAAEDVPDHDLLTAGFPCQAFSIAGKRLGFEDTRGTLFFEVARIAKVKRPKIVLLENVKGLISHDKGRTLDTIIQTLCDIGYTVDFNVLNSKYFGVPQNRERIFIIGVLNGETADWNPQGNDVVAKGKRRIAQLDGVRTFNFDWPPQTGVTTRLCDILEDNVDERFYLSEEKTAKLVVQLGERFDSREGIAIQKTHGATTTVKFNETGTSQSARLDKIPMTVEPIRDKQSVAPIIYGNLNHYGNDQMNRVYSTDGVSPTLTVVSGGGREQKIAITDSTEKTTPRYRIRKLTPLECFRLQGFPDEYHAKLTAANVSNSQLYKMAGNAVTVNVIEAIGRSLLGLLTDR